MIKTYKLNIPFPVKIGSIILNLGLIFINRINKPQNKM